MPKKIEKVSQSSRLKDSIVEGMLNKKGFDVTVLDLRQVHNAITDFFILCSGNSDTQVDAITDSVEEEVHKNLGQNPWHREGKQNKEWILLDYADCVVHVFKKDRREFYNLENLWGDAIFTYYNDFGQPSSEPIKQQVLANQA